MKMKKKGAKILIWCTVGVALTVAVLIASIGIYASVAIDFSRDEAMFLSSKGDNVTKLYYDGSGLCGSDPEKYEPIELESVSGALSRREWCALDEISPYLVNAFIATEDRRFFTHNGVNIFRTAGAAVKYIFDKERGYGGSTITQQVIKNISGDSERSVKRKVDEIIRAMHLEHRHSKEEILEVYMNIIPLGEGVSGVGLAAERYFGKEVSEITPAEAATVVALANAPTRYNPYTSYDACLEKRNVILGSMLECGYISREEYEGEIVTPILLTERETHTDRVSSWFCETVIDEVCSDLMAERGYTYSAARKLVMLGGLSIYTTMDYGAQRILTEYFENTDNFPSDVSSGLEYSMVICDSSSADLRAIVGGVGKKCANRITNQALTLHTPASTLKPLALYAPLIDSGRISWSTVFDDVPLSFKEGEEGEYIPYPRNSPDVYDGLTSVAAAIEKSKNTVALRLYEMLGGRQIFDFLTEKIGFSTLVESKTLSDGRKITDIAPSPLAFGQLSYGVSLRALTEAYTTFPNEGMLYSGRSYILCLGGDGEVLVNKSMEGERVYSRETSRIMTQLLMRVCESGTARSLTLDELVSVAGKTGTSGANRDKLFVGYTPYYTAGIWSGFGNGVGSVGAYSKNQIRIWDEVMRLIHSERLEGEHTLREFSTAGLIRYPYCVDSGKLFTPTCIKDVRGDRVELGYFKRGSEPRERCDVHILCDYDVFLGGVAVNPTFSGFVTRVALLDIPWRSFPTEVYITDAQYVYRRVRGEIAFPDTAELPYFYYSLEQGNYAGVSKGRRQYNCANIYRR
ncbi:MAG: transglycosylase domain-containing protein [Clostridia bacterium]|nr:transglycosylase domain-containing protein [Clostridia bacterium]